MRTNERRGRLSGGSRAPVEVCLDRPGGPPPTRVHGAAARRRGGERAELPRDPALLPDLPAAYDQALERGLVALGLSLPATARAAIATHVRLLLAWNDAINLTAITDPEAIATRHVVDSLTAAVMLADARRILDLGSGGGFPGLPLAAALPRAHLTLVDSVAKKASFLEAAAAAAGLAGRVTVVAARAETVSASRPAGQPGWDAVIARGVAGLPELLELALPLLRPGGRLVAWKRGDLTAELQAAARAAAVLGASAPSARPASPSPAGRTITGLEGHLLVEIRKTGATPPGYPRDAAARRRRPW